MEYLIGGIVLQHRLGARNAQRTVPPRTKGKRAMHPLVREQTDAMKRSSGEEIERDVRYINPRAAANFLGHPTRSVSCGQIKDQKNDQSHIMPVSDVA